MSSSTDKPRRGTNTAPAEGTRPAARRPDAKASRREIGGLIADVSLGGPAGPPAGGGSSVLNAAREGARHPVASGMAFERAEDVYRMDPRKIVLEGRYVRRFVRDDAFEQLCAAVRLERDIGQHVGVRRAGSALDARRILIYGMRRLHAALEVGLEKVPVRDYGAISEEKALELQMLENEIRADPHPADTAYGFFLMSQQEGWSQKRIGEVFDKNKGYVSEMVRVGEALERLSDDQRDTLRRSPTVTVRAFQSVAQVKDVKARAAALLDLLTKPQGGAGEGTAVPAPVPASELTPVSAGRAQAERRRDADEAVVYAKDIRDGRSFRVRWTQRDLEQRGREILDEVREKFLEEFARLAQNVNALESGKGKKIDIEKVVAAAAEATAQVDARLRPPAKAGRE